MTIRQLRQALKDHFLNPAKDAVFGLICKEIEYGKIELVIQNGRVVQWNVIASERERTESKT